MFLIGYKLRNVHVVYFNIMYKNHKIYSYNYQNIKNYLSVSAQICCCKSIYLYCNNSNDKRSYLSSGLFWWWDKYQFSPSTIFLASINDVNKTLRREPTYNFKIIVCSKTKQRQNKLNFTVDICRLYLKTSVIWKLRSKWNYLHYSNKRDDCVFSVRYNCIWLYTLIIKMCE